jgi:hypothetical protein
VISWLQSPRPHGETTAAAKTSCAKFSKPAAFWDFSVIPALAVPLAALRAVRYLARVRKRQQPARAADAQTPRLTASAIPGDRLARPGTTSLYFRRPGSDF